MRMIRKSLRLDDIFVNPIYFICLSPHEPLRFVRPFPFKRLVHVNAERKNVNSQVHPPLDQRRVKTGRDQMNPEDDVGNDEIAELQQLYKRKLI